MAGAELLTPVQYANRVGMKPQPVYNWIKKQGAPVHYKNGRPYVKERELTKWRKNKDKTVATKKKIAAVKKSGSGPGRITTEYVEKLGRFTGQRVPHTCVNCAEITDFLVQITYTGFITENNISSFCLKCRLNFRIHTGVSNDRMKAILDGEETLTVPGPSEEQDALDLMGAIMRGEIDEFGNAIEQEDTTRSEDCPDCGTDMVETEDAGGTVLMCPRCESIEVASREEEDALASA